MKPLSALLLIAFLTGCSPRVSGVPIDARILCVEVSGRRSPELVAPVQRVMEERIHPYIFWKPGHVRRITVVDSGCGPENLLLNLAPDESTAPDHLEERLLRLYGVVDDKAANPPRPLDPKAVKSPVKGFPISSLWSLAPDRWLGAGQGPDGAGFLILLRTGAEYKLTSVGSSDGRMGAAFTKRINGDSVLVEQGNRLLQVDLTTLAGREAELDAD